MSRPVTLFTGQWADLPLETLARKASAWGFDGLELACWGDHFDASLALEKDSYVKEKRAVLEKNKLACYAIARTSSASALRMTPSMTGTATYCPTACGEMGNRKACASAARRS